MLADQLTEKAQGGSNQCLSTSACGRPRSGSGSECPGAIECDSSRSSFLVKLSQCHNDGLGHTPTTSKHVGPR